MRFSRHKAAFNVSISQLNQNFLSNKKSRSTPLRYGLGAKKPILAIFWHLTPHSGTKLCPYELIFHSCLFPCLFSKCTLSRCRMLLPPVCCCWLQRVHTVHSPKVTNGGFQSSWFPGFQTNVASFPELVRRIYLLFNHFYSILLEF